MKRDSVKVVFELPVREEETRPDVAARAKRLIVGMDREAFQRDDIEFTWV